MSFSKGIVLLFILLSARLSIAQDLHTIDSLISISKTVESDSQRVKVYIQLSQIFESSDSSQAVSFANQAITLSQKISYKIGEIDGYYARAHVAMSMGHIDLASKDFHLIIDLSKKANYKIGEANGLNGLGATYDFQGEYEKALDYLLMSLTLSEEVGDQRAIASRNNNIGLIFSSQEDYLNAIRYLNRSLDIHQKLNDRQGIALVKSNMGETFLKQNELEKAKSYLNESLITYKEIKDLYGIAYTHKSLGDLNQKQGNIQESIDNYKKAMGIYDKIGGQYYIAYTLLGLGHSYLKSNDWITAKKYYSEGLKIANDLRHSVNIRDSWKSLATIEEKLGNYQAALQAHKKYKQTADSILNTEQTKSLTRLEANYEFEKEKDSIAFEQQKSKLAYDKELSKQRWIKSSLAIASLFLSVLAVILYSFYQLKKKRNEELLQKNEEINELRQLEAKMAEEALALKDRELATTTMLSHERNVLLQQLDDQISNLSNKENETFSTDLKEIKKTIKSNLSDESWSAFVYQFEKVHPKLFDELQSKFQTLTNNDLRLCAYIRVGMDRKEMANVSNVSPEAIKKSLYRLKKKMNLDAETDIREFLSKV